jgi:chromosome partitioning protein
MVIVSVLARKGGTGKSTAVRCLAVEALKAGRRVVIIDVDPQPTVTAGASDGPPRASPSRSS